MKYPLKKFVSFYVPTAGRRTGFTLVELMLAISIFSIVMLAAGTLMVGEARNATHNRLVVDMQRDTSLAMQLIGDQIRRARADDPDDNNDNEIHLNDNAAFFYLYFDLDERNYVCWNKTQKRLFLQVDGQSPFDLIDSRWEIRDFYVEKIPPTEILPQNYWTKTMWRVVLQVRVPETASEFVLDSTFMPRNSKR